MPSFSSCHEYEELEAMSDQEGSCVPDLVHRIVAHVDSLPNVPRRCGRQREFFLGFSLAAVSEPGPACPVGPPAAIGLPPHIPGWCHASSASTVDTSDREVPTSALTTGRPGPVIEQVGGHPYRVCTVGVSHTMSKCVPP